MPYRQYNQVGYLNYLYYLHCMQYILFDLVQSLNCSNPCDSVQIVWIVPNCNESHRFVCSCRLDCLDPTERLLRSFQMCMKVLRSLQMRLIDFLTVSDASTRFTIVLIASRLLEGEIDDEDHVARS